MLTLEEVRDGLKPFKLRRVAQEVGIDATTIYAIMKGGNVYKPGYHTVKKLSDYLQGLHHDGR